MITLNVIEKFYLRLHLRYLKELINEYQTCLNSDKTAYDNWKKQCYSNN